MPQISVGTVTKSDKKRKATSLSHKSDSLGRSLILNLLVVKEKSI